MKRILPLIILILSFSFYGFQFIGGKPSADSPLKVDLLGYWDLDAASNPFNDLHNSNDLTNNGADDVAGGHEFIEANTDYAERDAAFIDEDGYISFMIRVKVTDDADASYQSWIYFYDNDNGFRFITQNNDFWIVPGKGSAGNWGTTGNLTVDVLNLLSNGSWYTIVVVLSNTQPKTVTRVWVNNTEYTSTEDIQFAPGDDSDKFMIGARCCYASHADVIIAKTAIWQRALSAAEAQDISNTNYEYSGW